MLSIRNVVSVNSTEVVCGKFNVDRILRNVCDNKCMK